MAMENKKWLTSLLCASLAVSVSACGPSKGASPSADPSASMGASAAATTGGKEAKPQLHALNIWMKDDYNTYPVAKLIEEKTGYKVKYDMLPQDKANDKLNLLMASGESYDLVTIGGDRSLYGDYAKKGALVDLGPLIEQYGPNIQDKLSQDSLDALKIDGKIYGIGNRSSAFASYGLMIRTDWLEKVGMQAPATVDEFTQVLKAFKEKDPGGNGDKGYPFTITGDSPMVTDLMGAFNLANYWTDIDGKLVPPPLNPGFEGYLNYMAGLYKDGLLDKEFAVNKDATMKEKFTSGKIGVVSLGWWDIPTVTDALQKNFPDAKIAYLPALKGPDGKMGLGMGGGFDRISFIPKSSKHPEDAIKWINAKLDDDLFKEIAIGEEGKHYTVKDGAYSPILPAFNDERNQANNYLTGVDEKNYPIYWQARVKKDMRLYEGFNYLNNVLPAEARLVDPLALAPSMPINSKNSAAMTQLLNDYMVKVFVGEEPVSGLPDFIKKFNATGGQENEVEINAWYATVKK
ncbi:extracellular solute-binding protein [Cohnella nanjingensis]|uniref:Extracellular solute-binding protein n=1 Tax=Cohnella nanjingensis TaxID=1387779 RepID=A0A7X0RTX9_9BACL|nr:extracellular solute-binding protein [Cohnella nanjingensis]MBB6673461.1 extracellular solute-binding protein [Cohnella nanjingensis]